MATEEQKNDAPEGNTSVARGKTDAPSIDDRVGRRPGRGQPVAGDIGSDRTNRISMNPFGFNGSTDDDGGGRFAFATSLSKVRQAAESARAPVRRARQMRRWALARSSARSTGTRDPLLGSTSGPKVRCLIFQTPLPVSGSRGMRPCCSWVSTTGFTPLFSSVRWCNLTG